MLLRNLQQNPEHSTPVVKTFNRNFYGALRPFKRVYPFRCPWCKEPWMREDNKNCRACNKNREPCRICQGPVGRNVKVFGGKVCYKCVLEGYEA